MLLLATCVCVTTTPWAYKARSNTPISLVCRSSLRWFGHVERKFMRVAYYEITSNYYILEYLSTGQNIPAYCCPWTRQTIVPIETKCSPFYMNLFIYTHPWRLYVKGRCSLESDFQKATSESSSDGKFRDTLLSRQTRDSIFTVLVLILRDSALVLVLVAYVVSWSRVSSRH